MPIIRKNNKTMRPAQTLCIGFLAIILIGAVLLWLPFSSKSGGTPFFDCLFTAVSATCVTGLVVADTFTNWTIFGQAVIMLLIQIGGLGFVTIITFFNVAAGRKLGFRTLANAADGLTDSTFQGGRRIFISIMKYSMIFEGAGAVLLGYAFFREYGAFGIWMGVFTSVTAFCNAGFDLCGIGGAYSSLTNYSGDPLVVMTVALLVILGGLGFIVWENFLNLRTVKKLSLHTKAVLISTGALLAVSTLFYLLAEWDNPLTLGSMSFGEKLMNSFFSGVTTRTAGYNTISVNDMSDFSKLGSCIFMFIGASPASTGGGIKTTTVLVLIMTVVSYLRSKNDVELLGHKIDKLAVYRTLTVTLLSLMAVILCFSVLYFTLPEDVSGVDCLFEAVSAFSTAGLSAGPTAVAGTPGRILLMITMYVGRVGPVSLVLSMLMNSRRKNIVLPDGQIIVG
ncbi:MAG: potassium transporter Trk [Oscillospiraceae bacterium]|nr:potassium transporter Trk [Oscillospiraceae bacterium]